jgi:phosphate transport system protein
VFTPPLFSVHREMRLSRCPPPQTKDILMRNAFHEDLDTITDQLVEMTRLAGSAMGRATTALLDADVHLAESVIAADQQLDEIRAALDALSIDVLARQQPVATDLRVVVTSMRMSSDLERMGDLARHVAKVARLRYPQKAVPASLTSHILEMGQVAERIVAKAGSVIASKDTDSAISLEKDDDAMDDLHRRLFASLLADKADFPAETVVDLTLLGRYYERFADHGVSVARRVVYLVTGEFQSESQVDHEEQEEARGRATDLPGALPGGSTAPAH